MKPAGVDEHEQSTREAGHGHFVAVRHYVLRFLSDLKLSQQLDCRPWRCLTCNRQGVHREWTVSFSEIRKTCGCILRCRRTSTGKEELFTRELLLFFVELFNETLNARALRCCLIHYHTANSLAMAGECGALGSWPLLPGRSRSAASWCLPWSSTCREQSPSRRRPSTSSAGAPSSTTGIGSWPS